LGNWEIFGFSNFHRSNLLDNIPVPKSPGDISWKGLIQETSPGLNLEKFARVSKNLRKFSLSEWQFIRQTTKQRNVFVRPAETAGFGPWHMDILAIGRIVGNWEGLSVNWKTQNPNPIGNWTLEN
jgi:hypothetical protein